LVSSSSEDCYHGGMPGCCLIAALLFFGPRLVLAGAWLLSDWYRAFDSSLLAVAGFLFLPWTSLAWIYVYFHNAGDLGGGYVLLLALGVLFDLGALGGSHRAHARRAGQAPRDL
jgi:hypothetical protein